MRHTRAAIAGLLLFVCATVTAQQTISSSSSSSGVYTPDQAAAGEKIYFAQCSSCHGDDLAGREQAPALSGASCAPGPAAPKERSASWRATRRDDFEAARPSVAML